MPEQSPGLETADRRERNQGYADDDQDGYTDQFSTGNHLEQRSGLRNGSIGGEMFRIAIGVALIPDRDLLIKGAANGVLLGLQSRNSGRPANNTMAIAIAYIQPPCP